MSQLLWLVMSIFCVIGLCSCELNFTYVLQNHVGLSHLMGVGVIGWEMKSWISQVPVKLARLKEVILPQWKV